MKTKLVRGAMLIALVGGVGLAAYAIFGPSDDRLELSLSEYLDGVEAGTVESAVVRDEDRRIDGRLASGTEYVVTYPEQFADELIITLREAEPAIDIETDQNSESRWLDVVLSLLPVVFLGGIFLYMLSRMQGIAGKSLNFGRSKAKRFNKDLPSVTFADVAGADEAVSELREIKDFLENPSRFYAIGARIPKGVLLFGPPGTGKTLLARAVAGEAGVPFFSISGSDFVEMFVGVGASRVRDLFKQAKAEAPAIIFVDEIDAVGRHRGAGLGGGHDEREQTLNQMLVEMDGFDVSTGVILIAATNRPDILDPALLRPGRFDRHIVVDKPDLIGRERILEVYADTKPLAKDVSAQVIARRTPGFTGADLANLMNEAALLTARRDLATIGMAEVEEAIDRVLAGPERRTRVMTDREKWTIAYHEAGHALVGHALPGTDPIHKVSIISRGRALGWTLSLPTQDRYLQTRTELRDRLAMLLGGRTAEELIFADPTTGATDDIDRATEMARSMVTEYGMSERLGPQRFATNRDEVFLGREVGHENRPSGAIGSIIDEEIANLINGAHEEARELLTLHRPVLDRLASELVEHETVDNGRLLEIFSGMEPILAGSIDRLPDAVRTQRDE